MTKFLVHTWHCRIIIFSYSKEHQILFLKPNKERSDLILNVSFLYPKNENKEPDLNLLEAINFFLRVFKTTFF